MKSKKRGFTLFELIIAISIFTSIALFLGKFCHRSIRYVVESQQLSNYQFQCSRVFRFLFEDLQFQCIENFRPIGNQGYSWSVVTTNGNGDAWQYVYCSDGNGTIYRITLPVDHFPDLSKLSQEFAIATSIGSIAIETRHSPSGDDSVEVKLSDIRGRNPQLAIFNLRKKLEKVKMAEDEF